MNLRKNKVNMDAMSFLFMTILIIFLTFGTSGCVQEYALEPIAIVKGKRIEVSPAGLNKIQIRVNMVGTSSQNYPGTSDYAMVDVEGDFTLRTRRLGRGYVVARGVDYDIGFDNIYLDEFGAVDSLDRLIPATDSVTLYQKTPGEALFLVFEEDFDPFTSVHLVGDFNDFEVDKNARALHDDGSLVDLDPIAPGIQVSGDYEAGDKVWTLRTKLDAGEQKYGFIFDQEGDFRFDPYSEKTETDWTGTVTESVIVVK